MKKRQGKSEDAAALRQRAEAQLTAKQTPKPTPCSPEGTQRFVHELQVHQIELEMQKEELRRSWAEVEAGLERYTDLYDFAPVGYASLDCGGHICVVNLAGAALLGAERSRLMGRQLSVFVAEADQPAFKALLQKVLAGEPNGSCEVTLLNEPHPARQVHIEANPAKEGQECRLVMVDITARKQAEAAVRRNDAVLAARLSIMESAGSHPLAEVLRATLDEAEKLTGSTVGFYHFVQPDQVNLSLQAWSTHTTGHMCQALGAGLHYPIDQTGVWVDCVRQRKPVIHNDYASLPHRKGLPEGHAPVIRELVVPVIRNDLIVAVLGVGNKPTKYDQQDVERVASLADLAWDIAERKRVEEEVRQREHRLAESQRLAHVGGWSWDLAGAIRWTDETYRIHGVSPETFTVTIESLLQLIHPDARPEMQEWLRACAAGEKPGDLETRTLRPDGTIRNLLGRGELVCDAKNKPLYMRGTVQDITERKQAGEALRESENRFRAIFEHAVVGSAEIDSASGQFLLVNEKYCEITGYSREEMLSLTFAEITHPDDLGRDLENMDRLIRGEISTFTMEKRYCRKNKETIWVNLTVSLLWTGRDAKRRLTHLAIVEDITERKQAERQLEILAERLTLAQSAVGIGVWDWDITQGTIDWSPQVFDLLGLDRGEDSASFAAWRKVLHPADAAAAEARITKALQDHTKLESDYRVLKAGGEVRWIHAAGNGLYDAAGRATRMTGICQDVTAHRQIENVETFLALTSGVAQEEPFFRALARYLAQNLDMNFVCIDRLEGDGLNATTVAVWSDGHFEDDVTYALKDTPCGDVVGKTVCCFPASVSQFFPKDQVLRDLRAECYAGVTLWSHTGQPIGLIAVIGRRPLADPPMVEGVLRLVAIRAAAELERMDADAVLRESEKRYTELARNSGTFIWEIDARGLYIFVSPLVESLLGYRPEEIVGRMHFYDLHPAEGREEFKLAALEAIARKESFHDFPNPVQTKDGQLRWVSTNGIPMLNADGSLRGYRGGDTDITARKQAEDSLHANRELLRNTIESTPSLVFSLDLQHRFTLLNEAVARFCGMPKAEIMGKALQEVFPPDVADMLQVINCRIMANGNSESYEEVVKTRRQKAPRILMTEKFPIRTAEGNVVGLGGVSTDITERRAAEDKLRESELRWQFALEGSGDGVWDWNCVTDTVYYSPRWIAMLGYAENEIGDTLKEWERLVHPDDLLQVMEILDRHLRREIPVYQSEHRVLCKDGSCKWILARGKVVERNKDGTPKRCIGTHTDITDRKRAEELALLQQYATAQLGRLNMMAQLATGLAHELNQPLTVIRNYAHYCKVILQAKKDVATKLPEALEKLDHAAAHAAEVVQHLRSLLRRQPEARYPTDLNQVLAKAMDLMEPAVKHARIRVRRECAPNLPKITVDPVQIEQVLINLIQNAVDAMKKAAPPARCITLRTLVKINYPGVCVQVLDRGCGIPPDQMARLFKEFATTKPDGLGLGLAISRDIVEAHGGKLQARNNPEGGAMFEMFLPMRKGT